MLVLSIVIGTGCLVLFCILVTNRVVQFYEFVVRFFANSVAVRSDSPNMLAKFVPGVLAAQILTKPSALLAHFAKCVRNYI